MCGLPLELGYNKFPPLSPVRFVFIKFPDEFIEVVGIISPWLENNYYGGSPFPSVQDSELHWLVKPVSMMLVPL